MMRKDAGLNPKVMQTGLMKDEPGGPTGLWALFEEIDAIGTATSGAIDVDEFIAWLDTGNEEEDSKAQVAEYKEPVPTDYLMKKGGKVTIHTFDDDGIDDYSVSAADNEDVDKTASRNEAAYALVNSLPFQLVFGVAIVVNTVILACDHHEIDEHLETLLWSCNAFFTILFAGEIALKVVAYSDKVFWTDGFNIFDLVIVCSGLLELLADAGLPFVTVFRTFRIFRLFRVLRVVRVLAVLRPLRCDAFGDNRTSFEELDCKIPTFYGRDVWKIQTHRRVQSHCRMCTTAHPLHTRCTQRIGASLSEAAMRPNPTLRVIFNVVVRTLADRPNPLGTFTCPWRSPQ
jgi:hypothetical protein